MNSVSRIISAKANDLSMSPTPPPPVTSLAIEEKQPETPEPTVHPEPQIPPSTPLVESTTEATNQIPTEPPTSSDLDTKELKKMIYKMKDQLDGMLRLIEGKQVEKKKADEPKVDVLETGETIIEGVFNGEQMVGEDGKEYKVPANYASKSKMVEGDLLKLTITNHGKFIYKQIGPIERKRIHGELVSEGENGQWSVLANGKTYKVLNASVTFYKGNAGDEVILLVPEDGMSLWGAVDNIVHK